MAFSIESSIKGKIRKLKYQLLDLEDPEYRNILIIKLRNEIDSLQKKLEECQKTNTTSTSKTKE